MNNICDQTCTGNCCEFKIKLDVTSSEQERIQAYVHVMSANCILTKAFPYAVSVFLNGLLTNQIDYCNVIGTDLLSLELPFTILHYTLGNQQRLLLIRNQSESPKTSLSHANINPVCVLLGPHGSMYFTPKSYWNMTIKMDWNCSFSPEWY